MFLQRINVIIYNRGDTMKNDETSYFKKENKRDAKIKFEEFPGNRKHANLFKIELDNSKKIAMAIYAVLVFILLLLFSSWLNVKLTGPKESKIKYRLVNKYDGTYATIKRADRNKLFKEIGFDNATEEVKNKDYRNYVTTYAYKREYKDILQSDTISVYYDDNDEVTYVNMSLVYKAKDFKSDKITDDSNTILRNFANVNISQGAIEIVMEKEYYYLNDSSTKSGITYMVNSFDRDKYYVLTIIVER